MNECSVTGQVVTFSEDEERKSFELALEQGLISQEQYDSFIEIIEKRKDKDEDRNA